MRTALAAKTLVKTRDEAFDGYHQALAAHQMPRPARHVDPPSRRRSSRRPARCESSAGRRAFPDPDPADQPGPIEAARAQRRQTAATEAAALRRAHAERA
ncbi:hypothetical protein [Streptomyces canus]|uniref:hypothetical protein n=1 Tax=Streptomyces canus TaxID=58343 RepID=UPI0007465CBE|nr:hypothetical protein [Streptomyces canus]KUN04443.1 hypothetical protein AQI96_36625 [Streptomyces canus]